VTFAAQDGARCAAEPDPARRLACYDRLFRPDPDATSQPPAAPVSAPAAPVPTASGGSIMSKLWELDATDKRRKFVVRTHLRWPSDFGF
jgi:hypothetical protein